ncbi:type II secretion system protein [Planctomycetota bacterium]
MRTKRGFTLVEILIVVVILGILAAIVIPQFTEASTEAKTSSLMSDLQSIRSQIELYKIQHNDAMPGDTTGDGIADDAANFVIDLTTKTNQAGTPWVAGQTAYGPYLQKFPTNPFSTINGNAIEVVAAAPVLGAGDGDPGWYFETATEGFGANSEDHEQY